MEIKIVDWNQEISGAKTDPAVGIQIATLLKSDKEGTYITVIPPGASVKPHYHQHGDEHYHIISGEGEMHLQSVLSKESIIKKVKAKNSFTIPENVIHQLINTGDQPLTLIFTCPLSHLSEDRFVIR